MGCGGSKVKPEDEGRENVIEMVELDAKLTRERRLVLDTALREWVSKRMRMHVAATLV